MNLTRRTAAIAAALLYAPVALAQQHDHAHDGHDHSHGQPAIPARQPASTGGGLQPVPLVVNPPFARLWKLGEDGKVLPVDGILDIIAIRHNPLVDEATRERIRPLVQNWVADVEQLAIDNLDFIEKIEPPDGSPGVIDKLDINDMKAQQYVAKMVSGQLMTAGPLTTYLEQREGFTREQASMNQQITSDYLQQVMNQIMLEHGAANNEEAQKALTEEQKVKQVNAVSRFLYRISCRDAMQTYYRLLTTGAPFLAQALDGMELTAEQKDRVRPLLEACKAASTDLEKRRAAREVLNQLTFDQRREALARARDLAPAYDPIAELGPQIPPPPNAGQPVAQTPAPAPTPQPVGAMPGSAQDPAGR